MEYENVIIKPFASCQLSSRLQELWWKVLKKTLGGFHVISKLSLILPHEGMLVFDVYLDMGPFLNI